MTYKAICIGAGRIAAGWNWHDLAYTHAAAYMQHALRVDLLGFVDPDKERAEAASKKWKVPSFDSLDTALKTKPDIISVCTQPETQSLVYEQLRDSGAKVIWCEKPYWGPRGFPIPTQVNYMRRADRVHQEIATWNPRPHRLVVIGKLDHHTIPHFEDLSRWWGVRQMEYNIITGPCSYRVESETSTRMFPNGGVDGGKCFLGMLENILDFLDNGTPLWSPAP